MIPEDYNISITGRQEYDEADGVDAGEIVLKTTGTYSERGDVRFIAYNEYDLDDPKLHYTSVLKLEPGCLTLSRSGSSTRLVLEKGQRHLCLYDTGFATMSVGVFTSRLEHDLSPKGGRLHVEYTLDIDSNLSSRNELTIELNRIQQ